MPTPLRAAARELAAYLRALDENLVEPGPAAKAAEPPARVPAAAAFASEAAGAAEARPGPAQGDEPMPAAKRPDTPAPAEKAADLASLAEKVRNCRRCGLGLARLNPVFGVGSPKARLVFVGEGPGFQEDHQGEPFVGRSGQLLDKIMETVLGLKRSDVYIANIVKCHPMKSPETPEAHGNDRPPTPDEISACRPYLDDQLRLIKPACIVTLGSVATKVLLGTEKGISLERGKWRDYPVELFGPGKPIKVMPTYHPAALLRNPNLKRDTWEDMKQVKAFLDSLV